MPVSISQPKPDWRDDKIVTLSSHQGDAMDKIVLFECNSKEMNWADTFDEILRQNFYATQRPAHFAHKLEATSIDAPAVATLSHKAPADPELA